MSPTMLRPYRQLFSVSSQLHRGREGREGREGERERGREEEREGGKGGKGEREREIKGESIHL